MQVFNKPVLNPKAYQRCCERGGIGCKRRVKKGKSTLPFRKNSIRII